jgi:Kef-type K+ transport system membrane component KefB
MAGGVSGAASGGILGLVLVLLAQQFGYVVFTTLEQTLIILILVIFVFAVVFGIFGRVLKSSAIRRAKAKAAESGPSTTTTTTSDSTTDSSPPPPSEPGTPPSN